MFLRVDTRHGTGAARMELGNKRHAPVKGKAQSIAIRWECIATIVKVVSGSHVAKSMALHRGRSLFICSITKPTHHTMTSQCQQKLLLLYKRTLNRRHQTQWYPKSNHCFQQLRVDRYTVPGRRWARSCGRGMTYNYPQQRPYCANTQRKWTCLTFQKQMVWSSLHGGWRRYPRGSKGR